MKKKLHFVPFLLLFFALDLQAQPFGNALDFDGANDWVSTSIVMPAEYTKEAWVFIPEANNLSNNIVSGGEADGRHAIWISSYHSYHLSAGHGSPYSSVIDPDVFPFGSWQHVAVTYAADQTMTLYRNGVQVAQATGVPAFGAGTKVRIGAYNDAGFLFRGKMDEIRIWNVVRSQTEIQENMAAYLNGDETGLVAYYRFDQGKAEADNTSLVNELIDYTGNCNKGSLQNFAMYGTSSNWVVSENPKAPILTTCEASNVNETSVQLNAELFSIGETEVTTRGFCYSTNDCPTISDDVVSETGTFSAGAYNLSISGLTPGTTYYFRSFATNAQATSYGEVRSFNSIMPSGNALDFDGLDDFIVVPNSEAINPSSELSISAWVKIDNLLGIHSIVSKPSSAAWGFPYARYNLRISGGKIEFWTEDYSRTLFSVSPLSAGVWYNITCTYDGTTQKIYIDGVLDSNNDVSGLITNSTEDLLIGRSHVGLNSEFFDGQIDELRIWDVALSQEQIQEGLDSYVSSTHPQLSNLKLYYRFDQGDATGDNTDLVNELIDYSGNCNKGTLMNFALNGSSSNWIHTGNPKAPILTTCEASNVNETSVQLNAELFSIGETEVTTRGFCYSTSECPTISDDVVSESGTFTAGAYNLSISGLTPRTTYYYRSFATNAQATSYGEVQSFNSIMPSGNALDFDGLDDHVEIPSPSNIPVANENYTIEAWFYAKKMGNQGIVGWGNYESNNQVNALRLNDNGLINYWWANDLVVQTGSLVGKWQHVAVTFDGTTRVMYLNGVLIGSDTPSGHNVPDATNLTIGKTYGNECFNGIIDEVRIWNVARSEENIQNYMDVYLNGDETGLVAYYRFDQGVANGDNTDLVNELVDYSGNCNKGTLMNFELNGSSSNWVHTGNPEGPILTTHAASLINDVSAQLNGTLFSTGEGEVTTRGFCYSTSNCPTINDDVLSETGTFTAGAYHLALSGLTSSTTYYYRSFATNAKGTSYGEVQSFITPPANALSFDGIDDFVNCGNLTSLETIANELTIEAWVEVNTESLAGDRKIVSKFVEGSNSFSFQVKNGIPELDIYIDSWASVTGTAMSADGWCHLAATYDGTSLKFYQNGVLQNTTTISGSIPVSTANLILGGNQAVGAYWNGAMDEVRIWNVARTECEITQAMNTELVGDELGLVAYYNFNQGVVDADNTGLTTLADKTTNGNDGTLTNFALTGASSNWIASSADLTGVGQVEDKLPPIITSTHEAQILSADADCQTSLPDYTANLMATDNCSDFANMIVSQTPVAGSLISGSINDVMLRVTDESGNYAEINFNVNVVDDTNPVVTSTHNDQVITADENGQASLPDYTAALTATDNCSDFENMSVSQSPGSGTIISGETNAVTLKVEDEAGNFAEVTFNVEVDDSNTGIFELRNFELVLSPNPFVNELTIETEGIEEVLDFEIINAIGNVVLKGSFIEKTIVQTSNFAPGVYLLKIGKGKDVYKIKKIIKQ